MKLGFVTAILDSWTYEEMMDFASEQGFECVEVACWPQEKAERRYAGVSHIDAERVNQDDAYAEHIVEYAKKSGVEISSLAYYPNVMAADKEKSAAAVEHLKQVILASKKLGVGMVTTFIGRDQTKNVQENLKLVKEIWPPIIKLAEKCDVKIAIENCPMLFGEDQWPGGQNLMTTPPIWREVFRIPLISGFSQTFYNFFCSSGLGNKNCQCFSVSIYRHGINEFPSRICIHSQSCIFIRQIFCCASGSAGTSTSNKANAFNLIFFYIFQYRCYLGIYCFQKICDLFFHLCCY